MDLLQIAAALEREFVIQLEQNEVAALSTLADVTSSSGGWPIAPYFTVTLLARFRGLSGS